MSWIDPRYAEHQRKRWLRPDWQRWVRHDAHRFLPPVALVRKSQASGVEADEAALATEWKALRVDLLHLSREVKDLQAYLVLRRLNRKYEGQPRDDHGRYAEGRQGDDSPKDPGLVTRPALLAPPMAPPLTAPFPVLPNIRVPDPILKPEDRAAIERQLSLYNLMSAMNSPNSRAVLKFNARAFDPSGKPERADPKAGLLTREEVKEACERYNEVQSLTNQADGLFARGAFRTPQARGTAIHTWIRDEINGVPTVPPSLPRDPDFRSEVSFIKSKEVKYGDPDSIRVDTYENTRKSGTVCIYDIKTGTRSLSFARMQELATNVGTFYSGAERIIVTEVRAE